MKNKYGSTLLTVLFTTGQYERVCAPLGDGCWSKTPLKYLGVALGLESQKHDLNMLRQSAVIKKMMSRFKKTHLFSLEMPQLF